MSELWQFRELLIQLVRREVLVRYRHSVLGILWALLQPLGMMLLFTFVFTRAVSFGAIRDLGVPYPLFVYLGVLPWTLFASGLSGAVQSLASHRDLVTKVYFPQEILPLTFIASAFLDFCIAGFVLFGLAGYYHLTGGWHFAPHAGLLLLPLIIGLQLLLMVGLGMWLALANLWYRDVKYVFTLGIQMWMFLTNVLYPLPPTSGALRLLAAVNPMVPIISAYRSLILEGRLPPAGPLLGALAVAVLSVVSAWHLYRALEGRFAERV